MTRRTLSRRRFVEQHFLTGDFARERMAFATPHAFVAAAEGKRGAFVVIEKRGTPLRRRVAAHTMRCLLSGSELAAVDVAMTAFALLRRGRERHVAQRGFHIGRAVAIHAGHRAVRAGQGKSRRRVVEAREFFPLLGGMARFATACAAVLRSSFHARAKLAAVRVLVTRDARDAAHVIEHGGIRFGGLMALAARHGQMPAGEHEARFLMALDGERGRPVCLQGVAGLTAVVRGCAGKLGAVHILMAVVAACELHLEQSVLARRQVAFVASHRRMLALQRICG